VTFLRFAIFRIKPIWMVIKIPESLFVSQWVARGAPRLLGAYPKKDLDRNLIIDIFGLILREEEEPREGFYIVKYPDDAIFSDRYAGWHFVCYFSGMELRQLVGLILEPNEKTAPFRGALVRAALRLFRRGEIPSSDEEWENLWNLILSYPDLPLEQRIADIFRDIEARFILTIMVDEGVLTLDDLVRRVRERLSTPVTRDLVISYVYVLSALGLLEVRYDEKALIERVYLISDVVFYRKKPQLFKEIVEKVPEFHDEYARFASEYIASWEADLSVIPEVIGDPELFAFIERLRKTGVINMSDLSEAEKSIVEKLSDIKIVKQIGDNICLLSDPAFKLLFPRWTISKALQKAEEDADFKDTVIAWLNILREAYLRKKR